MEQAAPVIVLDRPQLPENIGACARAMANFGLTQLRLVAPREGWPTEQGLAYAAFAEDIAAAAQVFATLDDALADMQFTVATTARIRDIAKPLAGPERATAAMAAATAQGQRCALVFGCERAGLTNDAIAAADLVAMVPVDRTRASLNLAQAVLIFAYEWRKAAGGATLGRATPMETPAREGFAPVPARKADIVALAAQLDAALTVAEFYPTPQKRPSLLRNLAALMARARPTAQEIRTLRGIIVALERGPRRRD